jgi:hypothetical protein
MANQNPRRAKPETYVFSWSIPASGFGGDAEMVHPSGHAEEVGVEGTSRTVGVAPMPRKDQVTGAHNDAFTNPSSRLLDASGLRVLGLIGWSAIAGSGVMAAAMTFGTTLAQLGAIGGLWVAVGVVIWFVPPRFMD